MTQRNEIIYSDRLDTTGDGYTQEQVELTQLFFNYLKVIPVSDSNTLQKARLYLKKLYNLEISFIIYELISLTCCLLLVFSNSKQNFFILTLGIFVKLIIHCKLVVVAKKQRKYAGQKSTLTRKIFQSIINKEISYDQNNSRIEIFQIDNIVATKINQILITKQFALTYKFSIFTLFVITINTYSYIIYELIKNFDNFAIIDKICLFTITIPFSITCLILVFVLFSVIFHLTVRFIHESFVIIINIFIQLSRIFKTLVNIQKNKKFKKNQLRQYLSQQLHQQDACSICLNSFQNIGIQLPCQHLFHFKCIEQWFYLNNSCPICRSRIIKTEKTQLK